MDVPHLKLDMRLVAGRTLLDPARAMSIRMDVLRAIQTSQTPKLVTLDFVDVEAMTYGCADEFLGRLFGDVVRYEEFDPKIATLRLINMSPNIQETVNTCLVNRKLNGLALDEKGTPLLLGKTSATSEDFSHLVSARIVRAGSVAEGVRLLQLSRSRVAYRVRVPRQRDTPTVGRVAEYHFIGDAGPDDADPRRR